MSKMYELILKKDNAVALTLTDFPDWTSAMDAIKIQRGMGLLFDKAYIFEVQGRFRYLVNTEKS
ncbi:hypothetical protein SAMN03159341_1513 [Paenibacillus sp. 1_12]|nr:hypothetical protein SAMN03159341_1513 [Paenibacillus sp. 1_12]